MNRLIVASLLALQLIAFSEEKANIRPAPRGEPFQVKQIDGTENVLVYNDTQLYCSAKIIALGEEKETVLQRHAVSADPRVVDKWLIAPQSTWLTFYRASELKYPHPQGKNARVEILSGGLAAGARELSGVEEKMQENLFWRGAWDGFVLPLLTSSAGLPIVTGSRAKSLQTAIAVALSQNHGMYNDVKRAAAARRPGAIAALLINAIVRDFQASGPLSSVIAKEFGKAIAVKVGKRIVFRAGIFVVTTAHPVLKTAEAIVYVIEWGPSGVQAMNWIHDAIARPEISLFQVMFMPGVSGISPTVVRMGRARTKFSITGKSFDDPWRKPKAHFFDRGGKRFYSSEPRWVARDGETMQVEIPRKALTGLEGYITCRVTFGDSKMHRIHERIRLITGLEITSVRPAAARPNQRVRIFGNGIYPFTTANEVRFGDVESREYETGKVIVAGPNYLDVIVPRLLKDPAKLQVWVKEKFGSTTRESNALDFERLSGKFDDAEEERLAELMPEQDFVVEGVLTPEKPKFSRPIAVLAGMQIYATLEQLSGPKSDPDRFELKQWALAVRAETSKGARAKWVAFEPGPIRYRQPMSNLQHTTGGERANLYYLRLDHLSGKEIHFKVRIRTFAKGDADAGRDAGADPKQALELAPGGPVQCHLYGEPGIHREDKRDWYVMHDVPEYERVRVTIHPLRGAHKTQPVIATAQLYRMRAGSLERVAATPANIGFMDGATTLEHDDTETRDVYLEIVHGGGLIDYRLSLKIEQVSGPSLKHTPVTSRFNDGTDENWSLVGNFSGGPIAPALVGRDGDGYISGSDPAGGARGPLDVVFVVDTTRSMESTIASVRSGSQEIVRELRRRSTSLRVGVVSFTDYKVNGSGARNATALSDDVEARLARLGSLALGSGGEDFPEDSLYGIDAALDMEWRTEDEQGREVAKVILVITDAAMKVNGRGKDFAGRSVSSMGAKARKKQITIYPMPVSGDGTLAGQARNLARSTRGRVLSVNDARGVAKAIADIMEFAVDSSSPRYFNAPEKFLGDVKQYYGRTLGWDLRGKPEGRRFSDPDVILKGGELTLYLQSAMAPSERGSRRGPEFERHVVRLRADQRWFVTQSGKRATKEQLVAVLGSLKQLRLRGEFYAGTDGCALDNVVLGGSEGVTDGGMTDSTLQVISSMADRAAWLRREQDRLDKMFGLPRDVLVSRFRAARIKDPEFAATDQGNTLSLALYHGSFGEPSVITALHDIEAERIEHNVRYLRRSGEISKAQFKAINQDLKSLRQRQKLFAQTTEQLLRSHVDWAKAKQLDRSAPAGDSFRYYEKVRKAEQAVTDFKEFFDKLRAPVSTRLLGD